MLTFAHPPTPSATAIMLLFIMNESSPPLYSFLGWGIMVAADFRNPKLLKYIFKYNYSSACVGCFQLNLYAAAIPPNAAITTGVL